MTAPATPTACVGCRHAEWKPNKMPGRCTHPMLLAPLAGYPLAAFLEVAPIWAQTFGRPARTCPTREPLAEGGA